MALDKAGLAASGLRWSGGGKLLRAFSPWQGILVLNYHRIGNPAATEFDRDVFSARQDAFDRQIGFLKSNFTVIVPADLPVAVASKRGRYLLITFDDGYRDNFDLAFPVLTRHGVAATFFVCTGFIDDPRVPWWDEIAWMLRTSGRSSLPADEWFTQPVELTGEDRTPAIRTALQTFKTLPAERTSAFMGFLRETTGREITELPPTDLWMRWEMISDLQAAGMTIGAHTVRHHLLARLDAEGQKAEITGSRDRITEMTGRQPRAFAYPVGSRSAFTETTKALLRDAGFEAAFSFYGGYQPFELFDPFDIRRAHVGHAASQTLFQGMTTLPQLFARW